MLRALEHGIEAGERRSFVSTDGNGRSSLGLDTHAVVHVAHARCRRWVQVSAWAIQPPSAPAFRKKEQAHPRPVTRVEVPVGPGSSGWPFGHHASPWLNAFITCGPSPSPSPPSPTLATYTHTFPAELPPSARPDLAYTQPSTPQPPPPTAPPTRRTRTASATTSSRQEGLFSSSRIQLRRLDVMTTQSAERLLMNEFKALSKETWTNIEVSRSCVLHRRQRHGEHPTNLCSLSTRMFSSGAPRLSC
jgi:hypothetical protein